MRPLSPVALTELVKFFQQWMHSSGSTNESALMQIFLDKRVDKQPNREIWKNIGQGRTEKHVGKRKTRKDTANC